MPSASELARIEAAEADALNLPDNPLELEVGIPLQLDAPTVFGSANFRLSQIPPEGEKASVLALEQHVDRDTMQAIANRVHRGTIELSCTDAFGKQRTLRVTPAEFIVLLQLGEKFVKELPR